MPLLLLIDDEPAIQHAFKKAFYPPNYETLAARTASEGVALFAERKPDVVVLDVNLPDSSGLQTFDRIKQIDARTPVILITGHGTTDLAIQAMKRGAFDYLPKPLPFEQLRELIGRAAEVSRLMNVPAVVAETTPAPADADALVGRCPAMHEVYKAIGRVAGTDATVLILGDTGTGKELVARAIYQHGNRADKPFLAVNCGAIPEPLLESELFGHEKGAFTGADRKRIGKFEQCTGGTLFLDELGELPLLSQVKLLRAIQEQRFERVGGTETLQTDVRVIAATNADLEKLVAQGRFRSDLYFRLNVFTIELPSLRQRGDDIDLLTDYYLNRFASEFGRPVPIVSPEFRDALRRYRWPGNIRELQSVLKQGMLKMSGGILLPDVLASLQKEVAVQPTETPAGNGSAPVPVPAVPNRPALDWDQFIAERLDAGSRELYSECLTVLERQLLTRVLERTGGNQLRAAELLGITRGSLRHKLRALGLTIERSLSADDDHAD
ncbi:response regulator with -like aaa-type and dna-binding domains : Response regulator with CheY-like receiver, AAA-type ATPase, and DNA-binding domains OS=Singulisphaera acidiphila (strain ATCC BAA-1392 / DSM 18658 / VKM B-2454 / MOB10) GN=Sinac_1278 PE=4 SV=1: Response_reg: Sigma54_activat: HTH_8 [Gemmata massiliana]|uniref:DNA-binding transcriptional regulator NtrC n=1 Tax=Gemmata massiliana TaxID=1210884 RepID=A0A6P2D0P0_9BACT|nr:sigma-54 dependent transcriptional regulator [Gemmata massiliana]VTR93644.1 response regulator with -like aaa-type and dna-binding domains : Response regulator with CheY-like receiver, AAA-type ATPase, and DNA-binding domains OS=Singulisphaera acidiphila (strain ATCC BAA-1392 / DSM 18658 / VKM B-2454 / MOB10) GN=Sinac_1278 PE=4 SV=1: Response_reg: Sigma54_activat: HTH_8 [Gemmata massiliana]